jgi:hypothetical protein
MKLGSWDLKPWEFLVLLFISPILGWILVYWWFFSVRQDHNCRAEFMLEGVFENGKGVCRCTRCGRRWID